MLSVIAFNIISGWFSGFRVRNEKKKYWTGKQTGGQLKSSTSQSEHTQAALRILRYTKFNGSCVTHPSRAVVIYFTSFPWTDLFLEHFGWVADIQTSTV